MLKIKSVRVFPANQFVIVIKPLRLAIIVVGHVRARRYLFVRAANKETIIAHAHL